MNFSRIGGQLVCKIASLRIFLVACLAVALNFAIATLFAMMFVACSLGGSTEETSQSIGGPTENNVQASLENISVKGLAMINVAPETADSAEMSVSLTGMPKGSVVTLYELDPDSLEKTGVSFADTIDNDNGVFDIQGVTLSSPYVWITAVEKEGLSMDIEYRSSAIGGTLQVNAFVDVRDTAPVTVDIFSDLIAYRARVLVLIGNDYEDAIAQAKREILEAFGVYGISFDSLDATSLDYYAMQSVLVGVANALYITDDVRSSESLAKSFEQTGSFLREKASIVYGVQRVAGDMRFRLSIPQGAYDQMGAVAAKEYQSMLLYEKYLAGMLSVMLGAGQCSVEKEGTSIDVFKNDYDHRDGIGQSIVCRSGSWHLTYEQVPHTFGTMTDARDGKTYKTVTIDLGGTTQTWMAENLNYNGAEFGTAKCLNDKPENCNIYGRLYDWNMTMGLGESVLRNIFDSRQECLDSISKNYYLTPIPYDSAFIEECIASKALYYDEEHGGAYFDSADVEKCMYYGGAIPINYDSLRTLYDVEIQEQCDQAMSDSVRFVDFSLINLDSIARTQGVCPDGWRIPTVDDWEKIFQYIDRRWKSYAEGLYLLWAPSIGDPFGFSLYNTVDMEWTGDRSLKTEGVIGKYAMVPKEDDLYGSVGFVGTSKSLIAMSMGYAFNYESVSVERLHKDFFVRCIKD